MIKRIIFDVDNTLIQWKKEYYQMAILPFEELNIPYTKQDLHNLEKAISDYEKEYQYFKIENLQKMFCKTLKRDLPNNFTSTVLKYFKTCVPEKLPPEEIETLEYLKSKYELVILTNWFEDVQVERLKKTEIYNYFTKIYATENIKIKPNPESFLTAIGDKNPQECVMIGDNLKTDIQGALDCGISAIYITKNHLDGKKVNYTIINSLTELKNIL